MQLQLAGPTALHQAASLVCERMGAAGERSASGGPAGLFAVGAASAIVTIPTTDCRFTDAGVIPVRMVHGARDALALRFEAG